MAAHTFAYVHVHTTKLYGSQVTRVPCCLQAASEVDSMQKELTQAKVVVEAATQDCNALLEVITTSTTDVETKQSVAIAKEEELKVSKLAAAAALRTKSNVNQIVHGVLSDDGHVMFTLLLSGCLLACVPYSMSFLHHMCIAAMCTQA